MNTLFEASTRIEKFRAGSLGSTVAKVEAEFIGSSKETTSIILAENQIGMDLLLAAILFKKYSSQINEIIHAVGILLALPTILREGEIIESLSLAAGNTGKGFDLETNQRIAEFTFIQWQGGPEVIRQNKILKDFYFLAEADTAKEREIYTIGTVYPEKFFRSKRSLVKILEGNAKLGGAWKYGIQFSKVCDYCVPRLGLVKLRDICAHIPSLKQVEEV
jgi:hypothetical protein